MTIKKRTITLRTTLCDGLLVLQDGIDKATFSAKDHQSIGNWLVSRVEMVNISKEEPRPLVEILEEKLNRFRNKGREV